MNPAADLETTIYRSKRNQVIQQRVSEGRLTDLTALRKFMNSQETHQHISTLRTLLWQTDEAMHAEDVPEETRDRILHRLIHGAPPDNLQAEAEHRKQMSARGLELQGMSAALISTDPSIREQL